MRRTLLILTLATGLGGLLAAVPAHAAPATATLAASNLVVAAERASLDGAVVNEATGVQNVQYYRRNRRYYRRHYTRRYRRY